MRGVTIILLLLSSASHGQFGFGAQYNAGYGFISHNSFDSFVSSYNDIIQQQGFYENDLKPLRGSFQQNFDFFATAGGFAKMSFGGTYARSSTSVSFNDGTQRTLSNKTGGFSFVTSFGVYPGQSIHAGLGFGIDLFNSVIESSRVYSNGEASYGEDGRLNGYYKALLLKPSLHAEFSVPISQVLYVNLNFSWLMKGEIGGKDIQTDYIDDFAGKTFDASSAAYERLPIDYQPSQNFTFEDDAVFGDYSSFSILIGLSIYLGE